MGPYGVQKSTVRLPGEELNLALDNPTEHAVAVESIS